ncbi:hypothetical protein [uncultured Anaerococcus sp.]|uniref:hypothetical protein n=1 Tax=uncultured Anaerococcus sp. TaxID=293428 RepID=UPI00261B2B95|nr:hypothetical protein [uncultured Anaerococcus sp.]
MAVGIAFDKGLCVDALKYYCEVFDLDFPANLIRYSDFPKYNLPSDLKDRIYSSYLDIYDNRIYFYDVTNDASLKKGNNVKIVIETSSDNLFRAYMNFRKDSNITFEPQRINKKLFTTL